jgi:hypothetical protein
VRDETNNARLPPFLKEQIEMTSKAEEQIERQRVLLNDKSAREGSTFLDHFRQC